MATMTIDTREFVREINRYKRETGKDNDYVVNRQALNVAIKAGQQTPLADKAAIEALPRRDWWPKFVAKTIKSKGLGLGGARWTAKKGGPFVKDAYTIAQARRVSKRLVTARKKRVGYIRSGWMKAIAKLSAAKAGAKARALKGTKGFKNTPGDAILARPGELAVATIINAAKGARKVGSPGLGKAIILATQDMQDYIRQRHGKTAKKFNR